MARRGHHTLEQIKDMVLVAAEELVMKGGLDELTVRKVAVKIGYTVGSIYMVFESMNDLILHIKARALDELAGELDKVKTRNPKRCLEEYAIVYAKFANANLNRWSIVFGHRLPEEMTIPEWYQRKVDAIFGKFEEQFRCLTPNLPDKEIKQTALAFIGGIQGASEFLLSFQLGGFNQDDLEESVVLLTKRFIHDGWVNQVSGMALPKKVESNKKSWEKLPATHAAM